jgi:hypothetical protein
MQSIDSKILTRIQRAGRGWVFTPTQLTDLGSRAAIDQTLSRLSTRGTFRRPSVDIGFRMLELTLSFVVLPLLVTALVRNRLLGFAL